MEGPSGAAVEAAWALWPAGNHLAASWRGRGGGALGEGGGIPTSVPRLAPPASAQSVGWGGRGGLCRTRLVTYPRPYPLRGRPIPVCHRQQQQQQQQHQERQWPHWQQQQQWQRVERHRSSHDGRSELRPQWFQLGGQRRQLGRQPLQQQEEERQITEAAVRRLLHPRSTHRLWPSAATTGCGHRL